MAVDGARRDPGSGGHARNVCDLLKSLPSWQGADCSAVARMAESVLLISCSVVQGVDRLPLVVEYALPSTAEDSLEPSRCW